MPLAKPLNIVFNNLRTLLNIKQWGLRLVYNHNQEQVVAPHSCDFLCSLIHFPFENEFKKTRPPISRRSKQSNNRGQRTNSSNSRKYQSLCERRNNIKASKMVRRKSVIRLKDNNTRARNMPCLPRCQLRKRGNDHSRRFIQYGH